VHVCGVDVRLYEPFSIQYYSVIADVSTFHRSVFRGVAFELRQKDVAPTWNDCVSTEE
jgi:hypothetical protein